MAPRLLESRVAPLVSRGIREIESNPGFSNVLDAASKLSIQAISLQMEMDLCGLRHLLSSMQPEEFCRDFPFAPYHLKPYPRPSGEKTVWKVFVGPTRHEDKPQKLSCSVQQILFCDACSLCRLQLGAIGLCFSWHQHHWVSYHNFHQDTQNHRSCGALQLSSVSWIFRIVDVCACSSCGMCREISKMSQAIQLHSLS
jgi:hypothetical protein